MNKGLVQEIVFLVFHRCLYNKQNITCPLVDTNFIFSCSTRYLTRSLRSLVRYRVEYSKIKFVSTRGHVISSMYQPLTSLDYCSVVWGIGRYTMINGNRYLIGKPPRVRHGAQSGQLAKIKYYVSKLHHPALGWGISYKCTYRTIESLRAFLTCCLACF